jgi:hypothetical protein
MQRHPKAAITLICGLTIASTAAWGAEPTPAPPPLGSGEANAFALQVAGASALMGAGLFGIGEAMRAKDAKDQFFPARLFQGFATGGAVGGAASGLGLALFVDRQPSWLGAAAASVIGLAAGTGGILWLDQLGKGTPPDETVYALVSLTLPVVTAMLSSLTYQGIRMLTTPQPSPTPIPLQTPWPSPTPPVRLYL